MAKKEALPETETSEATLTPEIAKSIEDLIFQKKQIGINQEAYKEALEKIADKLGVKKGVLSSRVDLIIREEEKGGAIKSKSDDLAFAEKYFNVKDKE